MIDCLNFWLMTSTATDVLPQRMMTPSGDSLVGEKLGVLHGVARAMLDFTHRLHSVTVY